METLPNDQNVLCFSDEPDDNLIVFGDTALWCGSLKAEALSQALALLNDEQLIEDEFAVLMKPIAYETISKVECNLYENMVTIYEGPAESFKSTLLNVHDVRSRNHFLDLIKDRLGEGWTTQVQYYTRLKSAGPPVFGLVILSLILALILWVSTFPELDAGNAKIRPRRRILILSALIWILSFVGWFWLACFIGSLMLVLVIWLAFRMVSPPVVWTLNPRTTSADTISEIAPVRPEVIATSLAAVDQPASSRNRLDPAIAPVAWIRRQRPEHDQPSENAKNSSKMSDLFTWGVLVSLAIVSLFIIGRILVLVDTSAWIFNAIFITLHASTLMLLMWKLGHRLWTTSLVRTDNLTPADSDASLVPLIPIVLIILCLLSGSILAIKPADHIVFSAFVTGFSCLGALFDLYVWRRLRRHQRQRHNGGSSGSRIEAH